MTLKEATKEAQFIELIARAAGDKFALIYTKAIRRRWILREMDGKNYGRDVMTFEGSLTKKRAERILRYIGEQALYGK